jgi:hypothetical protein
MRVRTGYEKVIAHRTNEVFAYPAERDGTILKVDNKLGIVKIKYEAKQLKSVGPLQISYSDVDIKYHLEKKNTLHTLQPTSEFKYKVGDILTVNKHATLQIFGIMTVDSLDKINDISVYPSRDIDKVKNVNGISIIKLSAPIQNAKEDTDLIKFGERYTNISGSYMKQTIVLNVKEGQTIKKGDIVAYNSGFFEPDDFEPNQVNWKHGIEATVAFLETDSTYEDSNAISKEFSQRMTMSPAHMRTLKVTNKTILHSIVAVGDEVQTTDFLCVIEDAEIDAFSLSDDPATVEFLSNLNRKAPKAKYHGKIASIDVLYSCPLEDMHPTVREFVEKVNAPKIKLAKEAGNTMKHIKYPVPDKITGGSRYMDIEVDDDTIVILICITEDTALGVGSKLVNGLQLKSITSEVTNIPISTESGLVLDMLFSGKGVQNRIVTSPLYMGTLERVLEKLEDVIIGDYFN